MPNAIGPTGLTTATQSELKAQLDADLKIIYGADINLESDSPDGQMENIYIQAALDNEDLITEVYNGFDPDLAIGNTLDERVTINGIQRQAGTFTITPISITVDRALTLPGLDTAPLAPFTVSDNAGNQWQLITTQNPAVPGTSSYSFQAQFPGAVLTTLNTITNPVTVILGVTAINNPLTYTTLGVNEETDAALRLRRQKSVSLASQGYLAGLLAALENVPGVTSAFVYENNTGGDDGIIPQGHSIWVIVAGTAADADVAEAIYTKRNAGCGMYNTEGGGSRSFTITQVDGSPFTVRWDIVVEQDLYIEICAISLNGIDLPNAAAIATGLPASTSFGGDCGVAQQVNINDLAARVQQIDSNTLVAASGFSKTAAGIYVAVLSPTLKNNQFGVDATRILIIYALTLTVASGGTIQFHVAGGTTVYTYSLVSGAGSIDAGTGLYTSAGAGTDVVRVTDSNGIHAEATIRVT